MTVICFLAFLFLVLCVLAAFFSVRGAFSAPDERRRLLAPAGCACGRPPGQAGGTARPKGSAAHQGLREVDGDPAAV